LQEKKIKSGDRKSKEDAAVKNRSSPKICWGEIFSGTDVRDEKPKAGNKVRGRENNS
jgi:hypothetical protein